jgi:hypothetical protein
MLPVLHIHNIIERRRSRHRNPITVHILQITILVPDFDSMGCPRKISIKFLIQMSRVTSEGPVHIMNGRYKKLVVPLKIIDPVDMDGVCRSQSMIKRFGLLH